MVLSLTCRFRVFVRPVAPERSQRYEKSSAEASVSLIMPRRSIFGEAKVRKVECRSKRQLDYAETKRKNNLRPLRRAGRSLRPRRPATGACSADFGPQLRQQPVLTHPLDDGTEFLILILKFKIYCRGVEPVTCLKQRINQHTLNPLDSAYLSMLISIL